MVNERLKQLEEFFAQDPGDPFNLYALALEYLKNDPTKAGESFDMLLDRHPDYLPTYYHAAKFFQEKGDHEKTIRIYEAGIALAGRTGDSKALRELRSAYDEFVFE